MQPKNDGSAIRDSHLFRRTETGDCPLLRCVGNSPTITNCAIAKNTAEHGGGIYCFYGCPTITNSVLWCITPQQILLYSSTPIVTYSNVQGGYEGNGNIDVDPLFVDPDGADDNSLTWEDNDYHLAANSPCIDAGDNSVVLTPTDLAGLPRIVDGDSDTNAVVDMGAYEFQAMVIGLDIKPGSCPNPLNCRSQGVLPVAAVGTVSFDVMQIDVASVRILRVDGVGSEVAPLEGPPGPHSVFADVATPFDGEPCNCEEEEGDGLLDLSMKFRTQDLVEVLELGDVEVGEEVELVVTGMLLDGSEFTTAGDCIMIIRGASIGTGQTMQATRRSGVSP